MQPQWAPEEASSGVGWLGALNSECTWKFTSCLLFFAAWPNFQNLLMNGGLTILPLPAFCL